MGTRETTRRAKRCSAAVRIALALAALTPSVASGPELAPPQLVPASAARVSVVAERETPREVEEWERLRRHHAHT
jgi:hypothetical protein